MKSFLEKVWAIDSSMITSSKIDEILDSLSVKIEDVEVSSVMEDIVQIMSTLSLGDDGGIFANGKFIQKDHVSLFVLYLKSWTRSLASTYFTMVDFLKQEVNI